MGAGCALLGGCSLPACWLLAAGWLLGCWLLAGSWLAGSLMLAGCLLLAGSMPVRLPNISHLHWCYDCVFSKEACVCVCARVCVSPCSVCM